ncbi:MAG TPA: hypothetical protein VL383_11375 [Gemmatimonadaceae bacterium]|nr:hypothetical protein [Gemmatimonadaceae bacterium]
MRRIVRFAPLMLLIARVPSAPAQQPPQFKAAVKMKDGADGSTATGMMYFGGAKMRTELTKDGRNIVILADPKAKSQYVLMPSEKVYMQMRIGTGPVSVPAAGPSDPTNPCGGGSGNTECVKGPNESVNGYDAVRWDYTSAEGVRTRAWVSTKLRFPVKSQDDNGSSMEFSSIAEGPQPATLFSIPAGYTKMDVGAIGGFGAAQAGMPSGRGNAGNPMAGMGNLPPEARAAMAAAMSGRGNPSPPGTVGSAWEKTKGWMLSLTVTGTTTTVRTATKGSADEGREERETYTTKYVGSIPLNYGTPGVPGFQPIGPAWHHQAGAGGSPEILAKPLTLSVDADSRIDATFRGNCPIDEEPFTAVSTMTNSVQKSASVAQPPTGGYTAQSAFKISPDLKTFDLLAGFGLPGKQTTQKKIDAKKCRTGQSYTRNETSTRDAEYSVSIDLKELPLPSSVSTITGMKKMPMRLDGRDMEATVSWTLTPIR